MYVNLIFTNFTNYIKVVSYVKAPAIKIIGKNKLKYNY